MKNDKVKEDIAALSGEELGTYLERLRQELFSLRLHMVTQPVKDTAQFKKLRRNIARVLTRMKQNELRNTK